MKRLLAVTLFLTVDLILLGSFVRVVDAGLGCPDWPGCYGHTSPIGALDRIREEMASRPDGPVTVFKAWVEMAHRYVASGLGLLIIALVVVGWRSPRASTPLALATLGWVILQGMFGMWTVTMRLQPAIVTAHLLGALVLLGLLLAQWQRIEQPPPGADGSAGAVDPALARMAGVVVVLVFVQAALGAWVSSNYATLACQDFPRCQGQWWPTMDLRAGFQWWRPLGQTADGQMLGFAALTAIHYVHRLVAYVVLAAVGWVAWRARRHFATRALGNALIMVAVLQLATGLTNVFLQWPAPAAILHTGGAAVLFGSALMLRWRARAGPRARMTATADSGLLEPGSELSVTR